MSTSGGVRRRVCQWLATCIGRRHCQLLALTLLLAAVASAGLLSAAIDTSLRKGYSPTGSASEREYSVYSSFFNVSRWPTGTLVMIRALDGGSLVRPHQLRALATFVRQVRSLAVPLDDKTTVGYDQLCEPMCANKRPLFMFLDSLLDDLQSNGTLAGDQQQQQWTFPVTHLYGAVNVPLWHVFYQVEVQDGNASLPDGWTVPARTNIKSIGVVAFTVSGGRREHQRVLGAWVRRLNQLAVSTPQLDVLVLDEHLFNDDLVSVSSSTLPLMCAGALAMLAFMLATMLTGAFTHPQRVCRALLVPAAVVSPLLAVLSVFGLAGWARVPVNSIMFMAPPLVLAIGVDDAFLLMNSWKRHQAAQPDSRDWTRLLADVLYDVGPSMCVTSLTNSLALAVGICTPLPAVQLFCAVTAAAIAVDFVLQHAFFCSALILVHRCVYGCSSSGSSHRRQHKGLSRLLRFSAPDAGKDGEKSGCHTNAERTDEKQAAAGGLLGSTRESRESTNTTTVLLDSSSGGSDDSVVTPPFVTPPFVSHHHHRHDSGGWLARYCRLITGWPVRLGVHVCLAAVWLWAGWHVAQMRPNFQATKGVRAGSRLEVGSQLLDDVVWTQHEPVLLFVNRPPDPANSTSLALFNAMLDEFASLPHSCGRQRISCWLDDYRTYYTEHTAFLDSWTSFLDTESNATTTTAAPLSYGALADFVSQPQYAHWAQAVSYRQTSSGTVTLHAFVVELCFNGLHNWAERAHAYDSWRGVAAHYAGDFNTTIWEFECNFFDLILCVTDQMIRTIAAAFVCMLVVCYVFVPSLCCLLAAQLNIASITLVALGGMAYLDAQREPTTMLGTLMIIGLTVDYSTHTVVHFYNRARAAPDESKAETVEHVFRAVMLPLVQAGGSTLLCVLPMVFTRVWNYVSFVQCISLVVSLGTLHAGLLLPVWLTWLPRPTPGS